MFALLSPRLWLAGALAVLLAFSHLTAYRSGRGAVRTLWDKDIARRNVEALQASEAARAKEQALTIANQKVSAKYAAEKKRSAVAAASLAVSLRQLHAVLVDRPASQDSAAGARFDDPRDAIIDQCAGALVGMDQHAKGLESQVTGLQEYAGSVCMSKP